MSIKKLIVQEFENEKKCICEYDKGEKYSHFVDLETGKYYRPKANFEVTGENLETMFEEIKGFSKEIK